MPVKNIKLYKRVYLDLLSKIKSGEYKIGDKLPTEKELTEIYGVSRITAMNAVKLLAARGLVSRKKRGGTIVGKYTAKKLIVIPMVLPFDDTMNYGLIYGAQERALELGFTIKVYNSSNDLPKERKIIKEFISAPPDGIIVYPCAQVTNIPLISKLYSMNTPLVFIDREIIGTDYPLVSANNAEAMFELTRRIIKKGYKKIGYYGFTNDYLQTERDRLNGFCMAHAFCKLPIKEEFLFSLTIPGLFNNSLSLDEILKTKQRPEVICCENDECALEVIKKARAAGLRIPEDLGVTGFDNRLEQVETGLHLTTVSQNFYEMGRAAASAIYDLIKGVKPQKRIKIPTELIIGDSVKNL